MRGIQTGDTCGKALVQRRELEMVFFQRVLIAVACVAGLVAPAAGAADSVAYLSAPSGNIFVTQATKTLRSQDGMALRPGDRISLLQGSKLTLVYANGCRVTLSGVSTVTIGEMPSCATPSASGQGAGSVSTTSSASTTSDASTMSFSLPPPARRASR